MIIDRSPWQAMRGGVIESELLLRAYALPQGMRVDVVGIDSVRRIACGPNLTLTTDRDGFLATMTARIDIDQHHFQP